MFGPRARPVLSVIADRFRSIHMVLFDRKRNSRGRLSAALRKTNPSQTISNGSMSARMRHIWCVHPRSIRFSRCTPALVPGPTGPRGKEIYCQTAKRCGTSIPLFTSPTQYIAFYISNRKAGAEILHVSDDDPSVKRYIKIGHLQVSIYPRFCYINQRLR